MAWQGKRFYGPFLSCLLSVIAGVAAQTCNFDSGNCGWTASVVPSSGSFYWSRLNFRSPTPGTGPSADHTTGIEYRGYYIHTDASYGAQGEQAWLTSPTVDASADQNFTFWYNMYSNRLNGMGKLQLFLVPTGGVLGNDGLLWAKDGNQGDQWIYASVVIPQQSAYNLVFVGTRGLSIAGDIALDDIVIADADTSSDSVLRYACDFETTDLCGYVQHETDQLQWTRQQGATPSAGTGPSADHSLGTDGGHYMYLETSSDGSTTPLSEGDAARLLSPRYPPTTSMCLTFFYHMYGANIGSLRVYVKETGTLTLTWSKSGSLGDTWYMAVAPLVTGDEFQIVFEAARGNGAFGDIAIDDVVIVNGSCPVPSVTPAQTTTPTTVATTQPTTTTKLIPTTTPLAAVTTPFAAASTTHSTSYFTLLTTQTSVTSTLITLAPTSGTTPSMGVSEGTTTSKALLESTTTGANETSEVLGRTDNGIDYLDGVGLVAGVCVAVLFWVVVYAVVVHFIRKKRQKQQQQKKKKGHFDVEYDPTFDDISTKWRDDDDDDGGPRIKTVPDMQGMNGGTDMHVNGSPQNGPVATRVDVDIEIDKAYHDNTDEQLEADVTLDQDPPTYVNLNDDVTTADDENQANLTREADTTADSTQDQTELTTDSGPNVINGASEFDESLASPRSDEGIIFLEPSGVDDGADSAMCVPGYDELTEQTVV
ncbi:MAM and LDL-receptor class A domain-containing protein 1-like isoform X1 [Branchiostoma floridae]|uniref:MAM and LDL-receptor class A domain-containing protein 1-like isoform X1 n=1 Tax=Branchiostoma floridae TaxID=7739 RepID=A0A9J7KMP0_BRAFL|nr:MAM and LDL-receptor class A domain-containing protein 1-like isoform X1 [Branchiostoma floridae]